MYWTKENKIFYLLHLFIKYIILSMWNRINSSVCSWSLAVVLPPKPHVSLFHAITLSLSSRLQSTLYQRGKYTYYGVTSVNKTYLCTNSDWNIHNKCLFKLLLHTKSVFSGILCVLKWQVTVVQSPPRRLYRLSSSYSLDGN